MDTTCESNGPTEQTTANALLLIMSDTETLLIHDEEGWHLRWGRHEEDWWYYDAKTASGLVQAVAEQPFPNCLLSLASAP